MSTLADFDAVVFDFDGTLADSYAAIAASVNHVRAGYYLAPLSIDDIKKFVGRGPRHLLEHTVAGGDFEKDLAVYRAHHPSVMIEGTRLLPGAEETLRRLHGAGKKLGLCSNKPRDFSEVLLRHLQLRTLFGVVLGPEDVARPKPAPEMLQAALARLGVEAARALYVGDMSVDIETARAAGVEVWVVPTGSEEKHQLEQSGPDRLLRDLLDLEIVAEPPHPCPLSRSKGEGGAGDA